MSSEYLCSHGFVKLEYLDKINDEFEIIPRSAFEYLHSKYGGNELLKITECERCKVTRS